MSCLIGMQQKTSIESVLRGLNIDMPGNDGLMGAALTGWPKRHAPEKKLNIYTTVRPNGLIFLRRIDACAHSKFIQGR